MTNELQQLLPSLKVAYTKLVSLLKVGTLKT